MVRSTALGCCFAGALVLHAQAPPMFHWPLDETSGTVAADIQGGQDGSLQGGVVWAPEDGHHQGAARFDGVNDRILLGPCDITSGGPGFSLSLWVKPDFVTGMERTLAYKAVGTSASDHIWSLAFVNATALRFRLRTGGTTTELMSPPGTLFSGVWYHVVASYTGTQLRIHVNGALMASTNASGTQGFHPQSPASIGATPSGSAPFSGWIDDVRIYDRGLSDGEIFDLLFETLNTAVAEEREEDQWPWDDQAILQLWELDGRLIREVRAHTLFAAMPHAGPRLVVVRYPTAEGFRSRRMLLQ
ncbi:MAG: LamG domain-containing protein [Flavobacteriales bacterium]|nr:LamG domain-containing protein [Flavobacteriales bacterium]